MPHVFPAFVRLERFGHAVFQGKKRSGGKAGRRIVRVCIFLQKLYLYLGQLTVIKAFFEMLGKVVRVVKESK